MNKAICAILLVTPVFARRRSKYWNPFRIFPVSRKQTYQGVFERNPSSPGFFDQETSGKCLATYDPEYDQLSVDYDYVNSDVGLRTSSAEIKSFGPSVQTSTIAPYGNAIDADFLDISGTVTVTAADGYITLEADINNVPTKATSGGIHIHYGTSCDFPGDDSIINKGSGGASKGHYYNNLVQQKDPWSTKWYSEEGSTVGSAKFTITREDLGAPGISALGRVIIIHRAGDGKKVGCAAPPQGDVVNVGAIQFFKAASKGPQSEYTGVGGKVSLTANADQLTLTADITGLPDQAVSGGFHIHYGTSCQSEASVGRDSGGASKGHYYNNDPDISDPWSTPQWSSVEGSTTGFATVTLSRADLGAPGTSAAGRVIIFHVGSSGPGVSGQKWGCAELGPDPATMGTVKVVAVEDGLTLNADLTSSNFEAGTAGGIHIHYGTTCRDEMSVKGLAPTGPPEALKGHYYDPVAVSTDPWSTTWSSTVNGEASASLQLTKSALGVSALSTLNLVVIVHQAATGKKIGCGELHQLADSSVAYFEAGGAEPSTVSGSILVSANTNSLTLSAALSGVEPSSSGGIHIHYGTSCGSEESVAEGNNVGASKGHYYTPAERIQEATLGWYGTDSDFAKISGVATGIATDDELTLKVKFTGIPEDQTGGGFHIHYGTSCTFLGNDDIINSQAGGANAGHYYYAKVNGDGAEISDPWAQSKWTSASGDTTGEGEITISREQLGAPGTSALSRVVIIHQQSGAKVACGVLHPTGSEPGFPQTNVGSISFYGGNGADIAGAYGNVEGTAVVTAVDSRVTIKATISNMPVSDATELGGAHIHYGTTCDEGESGVNFGKGSANAGHYYNPQVQSTDPWTTTWTKAVGSSEAIVDITIDRDSLGAPGTSALGRILILHQPDGTKFACAKLVPEDPWSGTAVLSSNTVAKWTSNANSEAAASVTISAGELGFNPTTSLGRVVIVHNSAGKKIGCSVLAATAAPTVTYTHLHQVAESSEPKFAWLTYVQGNTEGAYGGTIDGVSTYPLIGTGETFDKTALKQNKVYVNLHAAEDLAHAEGASLGRCTFGTQGWVSDRRSLRSWKRRRTVIEFREMHFDNEVVGDCEGSLDFFGKLSVSYNFKIKDSRSVKDIHLHYIAPDGSEPKFAFTTYATGRNDGSLEGRIADIGDLENADEIEDAILNNRAYINIHEDPDGKSLGKCFLKRKFNFWIWWTDILCRFGFGFCDA
jgi:Cu/Zn superoxide dismutase